MASAKSTGTGLFVLCALSLPAAALAAPPFPPPVPGGPATGVEATPEELFFEAEVGGFDYELVTITTTRKTAIEAHLEDGTWFFDTQAGSCWQQYLSQGVPIPARSTCTIQLGFHPDAVFADYMDVLFVFVCPEWHTGDDGEVVCDSTSAWDTVALHGVGTAPPLGPDLVVDSIQLGTGYDNTWTVTIGNAGDTTADLDGVVVQGYQSADTTIGGTDTGACGSTIFDQTLAPGATYDFQVGCSAVFTSGNYLIADLDITDAVTESDETNNTGYVLIP